MSKIKILKVVFESEIKLSEIPAFRGAMIAKVGQENLLFHNHGDDGSFRYLYPLIQYKRAGKHPMLLCAGEGTHEIQKFFMQSDWTLNLNGNILPMVIKNMKLDEYDLRLSERPRPYKIHNWLPLNQEHYRTYQAMEGDEDGRQALLESVLRGNILSMAKGLGWHIEGDLYARLLATTAPRPVLMKGNTLMGFDALFETTAFLPDELGLGGKVSKGFGTVRRAL